MSRQHPHLYADDVALEVWNAAWGLLAYICLVKGYPELESQSVSVLQLSNVMLAIAR